MFLLHDIRVNQSFRTYPTLLGEQDARASKRTTVMPRDMHCLLDLWNTIDPTSPIGRESALTRATREREVHAGRRRLAKQVAAARDKAAAARAQGRSVDRRTAHFLNKR
jgi:hypothetical protein